MNNLDGLHSPGKPNRPLVFPSELGRSTGECDLLTTKREKSKIVDERCRSCKDAIESSVEERLNLTLRPLGTTNDETNDRSLSRNVPNAVHGI